MAVSPVGAEPAPTGAVRGFRAGHAVASLAAFGAFGVAVSGVYAATGLGFVCPFKAVTGWDCPLCGGTRLGAALLHLDLAAAFAYNPLVLLGLGVAVVLGLVWVLELLGGPRLRPPRRLRTRLLRVHPTAWTVLALVVAVLYTVARHLFFPVPA